MTDQRALAPGEQKFDVIEAGDFRVLADSIANLAWIAGPDGSIFWYNRRWYEYTGTTFEAMKGYGWTAVHDPEALPRVMDQWTRALEHKEQFEMTFPIRGADGVYRPFLTRAVPVMDDSGRVLRWIGTNTDVSAEHAAIDALQDSERRFRTAAEAVSGLLWTNTPEGTMEAEQPAWAAFTGQTYQEYRGYGWASVVHPEDAQPTIDAWNEAVREGRLFSFEHRLRRRDGVYRLFRIRALPVRNSEGKVQEWVGVHTDITEERESQQTLRETVAELRRQEEYVEAAQLTNNVGFWRLEPSSGELFLSRGTLRLLGMATDDSPSLEECLARIHADDRELVRTAVADSVRSGYYSAEFRVVHGDAEVRWVRGIARVLRTSGEPSYLVGLNLDITEQKQSAEGLIRAEKLAIAGRLAASIAHEINNPLEAIMNLVYLLEATQLTPEQRSYCETMTTELQRVSAVTTHTLRFHRQSTRPTQSNVESLVDSVLPLFEGRIRSLGIELTRRSTAAPEIFGFDGELRQVIANLLGNAIDAVSLSAGPRKIAIHTSRTRDVRSGMPGVAVLIADNGPGIPDPALARIFDPFYTTKGDLGTGLGLWVSSDIVRKHNGTLRVRSSQRGRRNGATFRVFLPQAPSRSTQESQAGESNPGA